MVDLGSLSWSLQSVNAIFYAKIDGMKIPQTTGERKEGIICSKYPVSATTTVNSTMTDESMLRYNGYVYIRDTSFADTATFKTAMNGVQLVYELATPQTYQLTPQAIALLTGDNNVWSEDGSIEVKYRANIGLYVDKKISEVSQ